MSMTIELVSELNWKIIALTYPLHMENAVIEIHVKQNRYLIIMLGDIHKAK